MVRGSHPSAVSSRSVECFRPTKIGGAALFFSWSFLRLFSGFSYTFPILFLYFSYTFLILFLYFSSALKEKKRKRKEKKRKRKEKEKTKKRQEKTRKARNAAKYIGYRFTDDEFGESVVFEIKDVYYSDVEEDITMDFERVATDDSMSDDGAEAASDDEDFEDFDDGPPEPGDMQIALFRDFLDWKGLVLIEPTAQTHNAAGLSEYEKQRQARIEANQDMLRQLGLA